MAKSSRASTVKTNNQRLKAKVFGPVEQARMERLSAKLLEVAAAPKPEKPEAENEMKIVDDEAEAKADQDDATMDVDKPSSNTRNSKNRIAKRKKPSKIVFPKYSDRKKTKKR
ncbi:hypothetical protein PFICI_03753 [Pestalotiopsis fici W106-1]|uniref:DUF2423 domain-containing protein n=1 Tax=Pestalotiopsis fici (strain W106-1 / CGMCC3.15140) TaxID=1229662 RepID=W3XI55_PESFW|nr:uncharacterized protein PFICI_03753 [Pestalotiopsis fici W106-1]ETS85728.1 hypothetical protein PFICI_03753 [Pestalotiopsis fici W106-1]